jgi:hypothetical protein
MRHNKIFSVLAVVLFLIVSGQSAHAQWAWAKPVGVAPYTDWNASLIDVNGDFFFGGPCQKIVTTGNGNGFMIGKYSGAGDTARLLWSNKLTGGSATAGDVSIGIDAAGNSYMIGKFRDSPLKRADGTTMSHFLPAYFVAKYTPTGEEAWCKLLTVPTCTHFQVLSDGTVCIIGQDIIVNFVFGTDTINQKGAVLIEIASDGSKVNQAVPLSAFPTLNPAYFRWFMPGRVGVLHIGGPLYGPWDYYRGEIELNTKQLSLLPDSLHLSGGLGSFTFQSIVVEQNKGEIYGLIRSTDRVVLNETDTVKPATTSVSGETYLFHLDEHMKVRKMIMLTNPQQLAVRGKQVALTAIVNGTNGFISPDTTITIKRTTYKMDALALIEMDQDFKMKRAAMVEVEYQGLMESNLPMIAPNGDVFINFNTTRDLYFDGGQTFDFGSGSATSITMLAKLGGKGPLAVSHEAKQTSLAVYPNPVSHTMQIAHDGAFTYSVIDLLGNVRASGNGRNGATCDLSQLAKGSYVLAIESPSGRVSRLIQKE